MKTEFNEYNITKVAEWLSSESKVRLPVVQRGFVWKVSQIECLWDSIFRGYPIGALMLSHVGDELTLLDGQQRATSIALGFYNPWDRDLDRIGNAYNLPVVWIDVYADSITDTYKYAFRVVTRSHPWGYQVQNNTSILPFSKRNEANKMYKALFKQEQYTKLLPTQRLPFDAICPVPLCFLFDAVRSSPDNPTKELITLCKQNIPSEYRTAAMPSNETYYSMLDAFDFTSLINTVKRVMETQIPAIVLPEELLVDKDDTSSDESTLFIRLNSQGTRIEGEELMYSMFKAKCPMTKDLVDCLGMNLIPPSRVITLISRLILSNPSYVSSLSLAQFRQLVQDNDFIEKMRCIIGEDNYSPIKEIIRTAIDILKCVDVPDVVVKKYIRESPNGFLLLLHWLYENKNVQINDDKKKEIAARLYRNHWFGNDFDYYIKKNWSLVKEPDFWSDKYYVNVEWLRQYPLIQPSLLEKFLMDRLKNNIENHEIEVEDEEIWSTWKHSLPKPENITDDVYIRRLKDAWSHFLWKLLSSRDKSLILLAQRKYINNTFADFNQLEDLEDTNTPWDWDHIYPDSWVYRQWNIDDRTRRWEWRIGNFRAMSLTDNRSENNRLSPADRFNTPNDNYFIKENDLAYWIQLNASHKNIKEGDEYVIVHAQAIITRSVNIYENFLKMFDL